MSVKGLTNYIARVPGTSVVCYLAKFDNSYTWAYTLWTGEVDDETCIATGELDMAAIGAGVPLKLTPSQVAKIAFLLEVEYK